VQFQTPQMRFWINISCQNLSQCQLTTTPAQWDMCAKLCLRIFCTFNWCWYFTPNRSAQFFIVLFRISFRSSIAWMLRFAFSQWLWVCIVRFLISAFMIMAYACSILNAMSSSHQKTYWQMLQNFFWTSQLKQTLRNHLAFWVLQDVYSSPFVVGR
jgi:hypothetical protein